VAKRKKWLLQDKELLYPSGASGASFEPCDLLTEDAFFIHVKEGKGSPNLNHLFAQMSAAADLYAKHAGARSEMRRRYAKQWKATPLSERRPTFVAAIGRASISDDLLGKMLVAKISLLDHAKRVQALGFAFGVARFQVELAE
jgi:uncharacterized protein (TIGR04141 family)